ncbi:DUF6314 family protein [Celeribacter halophilus]|uniref:DUF6314 family protein n=1 Tax=Celeribacter halophilus TaxID=576117 RepID=UPI001C081DDB|nr:DUF6314 family protein [Celeribacter halophilus]MBU2888725.1 trigger factor [Celeribacter halophilus]MDO6508921.1 DUF6314 family protein [Celeribacter halophilus]
MKRRDMTHMGRRAMMIRLENFTGLWSMAREIDDRRTGQRATLTGTCRFIMDETGALRQDERGVLHMPEAAQSFEAERRYLWRADAEGIAVFFEDGRFFHAFDPNAPAPHADHACAPDAYSVRYTFSNWPDWSATWRVTGPRKDYVSVTRYSRQTA